MDILLLDKIEAEVEFIAPHGASPPWHPEEYILVHLRPKEQVGSTISFAVEIPVREYDEKEFIDIVRIKGGEALLRIYEQEAVEKAKREETEEKRKKRNRVTANLGEKLGLEFIIPKHN